MTKLAATLRALPTVLAQRVASKAAPIISDLAAESFDGSRDPYGAAWAPAKDGGTVTLRRTGTLESFLRYVAIGTRLRVALGTKYAKYQIGKRPVYPRPGLLPKAYSDALERTTIEEARAAIAEGRFAAFREGFLQDRRRGV